MIFAALKALIAKFGFPTGEPVSDPGRFDYAPQHFLNFFPLPQGHGSLRPILDGAM